MLCSGIFEHKINHEVIIFIENVNYYQKYNIGKWTLIAVEPKLFIPFFVQKNRELFV